MRQIIKLLDVPAEKIGALYEALKRPEMEQRTPLFVHTTRLARVLRAKSADGATYNVEIEVRVEYPRQADASFAKDFVLTPMSVLMVIYNAIGIFPAEENVSTMSGMLAQGREYFEESSK